MAGERCSECNGAKTVIHDMCGMKFEVDCPTCKGVGVVNDPDACGKCNGKGTAIADLGGLGVEVTCDGCNGSGRKPLGKTTS